MSNNIKITTSADVFALWTSEREAHGGQHFGLSFLSLSLLPSVGRPPSLPHSFSLSLFAFVRARVEEESMGKDKKRSKRDGEGEREGGSDVRKRKREGVDEGLSQVLFIFVLIKIMAYFDIYI